MNAPPVREVELLLRAVRRQAEVEAVWECKKVPTSISETTTTTAVPGGDAARGVASS